MAHTCTPSTVGHGIVAFLAFCLSGNNLDTVMFAQCHFLSLDAMRKRAVFAVVQCLSVRPFVCLGALY